MAVKALGVPAAGLNDTVNFSDALLLLGRKLYKPGQIILPIGMNVAPPSTAAWVVGTARAMTFALDRVATFDRIGMRVVTPQTGATFQFSIYATDQYGFVTGAPIYTSGSLSAAASGNVQVITNLQLLPGLYVVEVQCDTANVVFYGFPPGWWVLSNVVGTTNVTNGGSGLFYYSRPGITYGTFVSNPPYSEISSSASSVPIPNFRILSSP